MNRRKLTRAAIKRAGMPKLPPMRRGRVAPAKRARRTVGGRAPIQPIGIAPVGRGRKPVVGDEGRKYLTGRGVGLIKGPGPLRPYRPKKRGGMRGNRPYRVPQGA
jgi:hypothetical protein